jgi:hypothetical protein
MKSSIKKAVSGKTMRVATTFTGAAACAAAFAAPAAAGTAHVAQPMLKGVQQGVRPDITGGNCPGHSTYLHLGYAYQRGSYCFGGKGKLHDSVLATSFCGGNNIGWIKGYYYDDNTKSYFTYFHQGNYYAHIPGTSNYDPLIVVSEYISKWSGHSGCGTA